MSKISAIQGLISCSHQYSPAITPVNHSETVMRYQDPEMWRSTVREIQPGVNKPYLAVNVEVRYRAAVSRHPS